MTQPYTEFMELNDQKEVKYKWFLLTSGDEYYPQSGTMDWFGCFETREEAEAVGKSKIGGWYEVIDLREWVK